MAKPQEAPHDAQAISIVQKSKITLTTFNPKRIASEKEETRKLLLGTLVGRATGVVERKTPTGEIFLGLKGIFEAHVTGADPITSGILYMPESFADPLINILSDKIDPKSGEVLEAAPEAIQIAYRVYCVRDGNPQGYAWELEALADASASRIPDPLQDLRKLVSGSNDVKRLK